MISTANETAVQPSETPSADNATDKILRCRPARQSTYWLVTGTLLLSWLAANVYTRSARGTDLYLREGEFQIETVIDPITFDCIPCRAPRSPADLTTTQRVRVKLYGVAWDPAPESAADASRDALRITLDFLRSCPDRVVTLRFPRHRFDRQLYPRAQLYCGSRQLNAELIASGTVDPVQVPGDLASLRRSSSHR